jgi:hypothetical protein
VQVRLPIMHRTHGLGLDQRLFTLLVALLVVPACASDPPPAEPLAVGGVLEKASLLDQNEVPHEINEQVRAIFFAREMEGGKVIRALLDEAGAEFLERHKAVYVADISGMPTLIANMMAIPKMKRERAYPTLLDRTGTASARYPSEEGRVTVLLLDRLRVEQILYRGTADGLREAVESR